MIEPEFTKASVDKADLIAYDIRDLFSIEDFTVDFPEKDHVRFRGDFLCDLATEFDDLRRRFEKHGYTPMVRQGETGKPILLGIPTVFEPQPLKWKLNLLLFILTIGSTMLVGATDELSIGNFWPGILSGWPFSLSILTILGAHELGHYFAARYHKANASLPFFIPIPTIIGTMGAFIALKEPMRNRRALLDVGAAGPLAGLVFAVPILLFGLATSEVGPLPTGGYLLEGNSLFYAASKVLVLGKFYPVDGLDVSLNQVAWAGWCGLLVTGLNLLPVGQLDGGHMAYVLFGDWSKKFFWPVIIALVAVSFLVGTNMWWLWIGLLFLFGRNHAQPLDDVTPLDPTRRAIAIFTLIVFLLVFVPNPLRVIEAAITF